MKKLAVLLVWASSLFGADYAGIWVGQIPTRGGDFTDVALKLTVKGDVVEGKLYGDYLSSPIVEGKVTAEGIVFVVMSQEQAGNQINETRLRFSGSLKGSELELTREREGSRNAGNGGAVQFRGDSKTVWKLKRLI